MPYTMKKLTNLPAVIVDYTGAVTLDEMKEADYELAILLATHEGSYIYTIEDIRDSTTTFANLIGFMHDTRYSEDSDISPVERRMITVGSHPLQDLSEQLRKIAGTIPNFKTIDEALEYIIMDMMDE